jgi:thioredoxin 1
MENAGDSALTRAEVETSQGPILLEFGASWCGHCLALEPYVQQLRKAHPEIVYHWIEDGPGRPLGRSFRVKLWPTFVFLCNGKILQQIARPTHRELDEALAGLERACQKSA